MSGRKLAGVVVAGLVLAGLGLGGCNKEKQLQEENAKLVQENEGLKTEGQSLKQRVATLEQQMVTRTPSDGPRGPQDPREPRTVTSVAETRIEVAGDKLFASGSTAIMAPGKAELDRVAARIKREFPGASIRIEGYTDSDPIRKVKDRFPTNEALSLARATEVQQYLISKGISSSRIDAVGMGSANPKATKAASRRVEIVIIGG